MSITDDDLETTNSAIAKLEGIEPSGDISEFNARKLTFGPDKAVIGPVAHLAAERIRLTRFKVQTYSAYLAEERDRLEKDLAHAAAELRTKVEGLATAPVPAGS